MPSRSPRVLLRQQRPRPPDVGVDGNEVIGKVGVDVAGGSRSMSVASNSADETPQISPPISWLRAVSGLTIRPAAKAPTTRGTRISRVQLVDADFHEFGAEGELDAVLRSWRRRRCSGALCRASPRRWAWRLAGRFRHRLRRPRCRCGGSRGRWSSDAAVAPRAASACASVRLSGVAAGERPRLVGDGSRREAPANFFAGLGDDVANAGGGVGAAGDRRGRQFGVAELDDRSFSTGTPELFGGDHADHGIGAGADVMRRPSAPARGRPASGETRAVAGAICVG